MMLRSLLRCMPTLYNILRTVHILLVNIYSFPKRFRINKDMKARINNLDEFDGNRIWYMCVPIHNNLGDYAQYECISNWIKETYPQSQCIEIPTAPLCYDYGGLINEIKLKMKKNDIIIFQSGYTSSNLHPDEVVHRRIVKNFKDNRIIFFPQTVKYSSNIEAEKTAKIYDEHQKMLFMTRDKQSYEVAKRFFKNIRVTLCPDIVTSLIGSYHSNSLSKREGVLFCIRTDSEKLYTDSEIRKEFETIFHGKTTWIDTTLNKNQKCNKKLLQHYIELFSQYELVVTDRFHGTIISLISETPVIVLKTTDHKVSEGAKWFVDVYPEYIYNANDLSSAAERAKDMIKYNQRNKITPYFKKKYYDCLIETINML